MNEMTIICMRWRSYLLMATKCLEFDSSLESHKIGTSRARFESYRRRRIKWSRKQYAIQTTDLDLFLLTANIRWIYYSMFCINLVLMDACESNKQVWEKRNSHPFVFIRCRFWLHSHCIEHFVSTMITFFFL